MSQFSIMLNEGWTELMFETMKESVDDHNIYAYFIPIYFIFCHMFSSLVIEKRKKSAFIFRFFLVEKIVGFLVCIENFAFG